MCCSIFIGKARAHLLRLELNLVETRLYVGFVQAIDDRGEMDVV